MKSLKDLLAPSKTLQKILHKKRNLNERSIESAIKLYVGDDISSDEKKKIHDDILKCIKKYAVSAEEYFLFGFRDISDEKRKSFVPFYEHRAVCLKINSLESRRVFENKFESYKTFKPYYKREIINIVPDCGNNLSTFLDFIKKHDKFIVKPSCKSGGKGISIIESPEVTDAEAILKELLLKSPQGFIIEELVTQSAELAEFHPSSVNTVRISTLCLKDRIEIVHPFFKMGQGGKVIDNGAAGGILSTIDKSTGVVMKASDELGHSYEIHPDSQKPIVGFKIPKWEELIELSKELASVFPQNRFTGWDFALTDDGWVLIEGNGIGGFVGWQLVDKVGFHDELYALLKEIN